jgi:hypothetical protein
MPHILRRECGCSGGKHGCVLTLNLLTTTIVAPPSNASKWQMGFNSAFKGLTTTIVAPPSNASKWQMEFNSAFKGLNNSTCFGHLYAHLQEYISCVLLAAYGVQY